MARGQELRRRSDGSGGRTAALCLSSGRSEEGATWVMLGGHNKDVGSQGRRTSKVSCGVELALRVSVSLKVMEAHIS